MCWRCGWASRGHGSRRNGRDAAGRHGATRCRHRPAGSTARGRHAGPLGCHAAAHHLQGFLNGDAGLLLELLAHGQLLQRRIALFDRLQQGVAVGPVQLLGGPLQPRRADDVEHHLCLLQALQLVELLARVQSEPHPLEDGLLGHLVVEHQDLRRVALRVGPGGVTLLILARAELVVRGDLLLGVAQIQRRGFLGLGIQDVDDARPTQEVHEVVQPQHGGPPQARFDVPLDLEVQAAGLRLQGADGAARLDLWRYRAAIHLVYSRGVVGQGLEQGHQGRRRLQAAAVYPHVLRPRCALNGLHHLVGGLEDAGQLLPLVGGHGATEDAPVADVVEEHLLQDLADDFVADVLGRLEETDLAARAGLVGQHFVGEEAEGVMPMAAVRAVEGRQMVLDHGVVDHHRLPQFFDTPTAGQDLLLLVGLEQAVEGLVQVLLLAVPVHYAHALAGVLVLVVGLPVVLLGPLALDPGAGLLLQGSGHATAQGAAAGGHALDGGGHQVGLGSLPLYLAFQVRPLRLDALHHLVSQPHDPLGVRTLQVLGGVVP